MEIMWCLQLILYVVVLCYPWVSNAQNGPAKSCLTPNKESAKCISIYKCDILLDILTTTNPNIIQFLRDSQCGNFNSTPYVCCGTQSSYQSSKLTNQTNKPTPSFSLRARAGTNDARVDFDTALRLGVIPGKSQCGNQMDEDRVYGGEVAGLSEFPWMALLEYRHDNISSGFSCSGALISKRYVLTAAHCTTGQILSAVGTLFNVRLGEYHKDNETDCTRNGCAPPVVNVGVEEILYHPEYLDRSRNRYNDIALIRLSKEVTFSDYIQPLCLPFNTENDYANVGERLWVAGWGKTEKGSFSPVKLKVRLPMVDHSNCTNIYKKARISLRSSQICAGGVGAKDSCRGDSGGPLMTVAKDDPNRWFVEGIVSFGTQCGTPGWPGVYTKVSEYTSWILENMRV